MEDIRIVFSNIMEKLLKQAHKNKNVLEYKEINDAFKNIELTPEKFEWILDYFEKQGVDVLNTNEEDDGDDNFIDDDTEEVEIIDDADILVAAQPHGIGQTALTDLTVADALIRNGVESVLRKGQMSGLDQIVEAFGKIKVSNAVVTHGQIQYRVEGNGLDDPGGNIQDQKFDLQLVLNEPMARHARRLLFSVYDFASSIPQSPGVCTPPNQNGK